MFSGPFHEDILNSISEAVFVVDSEMNILFRNRAAEEDLPVHIRGLESGGLFSALPWLAPYADGLRSAASEGRSCFLRSVGTPVGATWARMTPFVTDEARRTWVLTIGPLLLSPDERDVVAFESMEGVVSQIAHEINNPLGGIRGAAQLLDERLSPEEAEYLQVIVREVDRLSDIVGELKDFASMSGMATQPLNIHEVIDQSLVVLGPEMAGITVRRFYDPSLPDVRGNSSKLLQVFINLFKNAAEAMLENEEPGMLVIRTRPSELYAHRDGRTLRWVEVAVTDNGPGVRFNDRERIFMPFVTSKKDGSGLGLAISKKILIAHQGMLRLESTEGRGATFKAFIPYAGG